MPPARGVGKWKSRWEGRSERGCVLAVDNTIATNAGTDREMMYSLEQTIRQYNLFAKSYVIMKEEIEHQR